MLVLIWSSSYLFRALFVGQSTNNLFVLSLINVKLEDIFRKRSNIPGTCIWLWNYSNKVRTLSNYWESICNFWIIWLLHACRQKAYLLFSIATKLNQAQTSTSPFSLELLRPACLMCLHLKVVCSKYLARFESSFICFWGPALRLHTLQSFSWMLLHINTTCRSPIFDAGASTNIHSCLAHQAPMVAGGSVLNLSLAPPP